MSVSMSMTDDLSARRVPPPPHPITRDVAHGYDRCHLTLVDHDIASIVRILISTLCLSLLSCCEQRLDLEGMAQSSGGSGVVLTTSGGGMVVPMVSTRPCTRPRPPLSFCLHLTVTLGFPLFIH